MLNISLSLLIIALVIVGTLLGQTERISRGSGTSPHGSIFSLVLFDVFVAMPGPQVFFFI